MHILVDQLRVLERLRRQCLVVKLVVKRVVKRVVKLVVKLVVKRRKERLLKMRPSRRYSRVRTCTSTLLLLYYRRKGESWLIDDTKQEVLVCVAAVLVCLCLCLCL